MKNPIEYIFLFRINEAIEELQKFTKMYNDHEKKSLENAIDTTANSGKI